MSSTPIAPNTNPTFLLRREIIASIKLTNQTNLRDGTAGIPVTWFDPTVQGYGNGGLVENIRIMPAGVNVASQLYLFYQFASFSPLRWAFWGEVSLPAVTAVPTNAPLTSGGTYPIEVQLATANALSNPIANPARALYLNPDGVIWGAALGTAIAGGVEVIFQGGYY